jgi:dihydroorotate dehydrogenase electron transfer subunit
VEEGLAAAGPRPIPRTGKSRLVWNRPVGPGWYVLRLAEPELARAAGPGQFVEIMTSDAQAFDPLLRRPMSVYWADPVAGTYDILYTAVGRGTRWLADLPPEPRAGRPDEIDVIGPFGNRFTFPGARDRSFLVGGGVGVAPLYFLARQLCAGKRPPGITLCMGARSAAQLQGIEEFRALPIRSEVATDDGSAGHRGYVTGLLEKLLEEEPPDDRSIKLYGCGPTGMNEALRAIAMKRGLWCEICLEARMACGFGICFGCVAPIKKELGGPFFNRRICWEGPVFDARLLKEGIE